MDISSLTQRCGYCGCWYLFRPKAFNHCWLIAFTCPGCGALGTYYSPEFTQQEAEAVAEAQNRVAGTSEAREQAARWEEEVERRAEHDARALARLFPIRFPQWAASVPGPDAEHTRDPDAPQYREVIRLLSENPNVKEPLRVHVQCGEVLVSWAHGWHEHVSRDRDLALADLEHLHRALDVVERIVTEQISVVALYRGEQLVGGGGLQPGTDPPREHLEREGPGRGDRYVIVSWRGTDDREIQRSANS